MDKEDIFYKINVLAAAQHNTERSGVLLVNCSDLLCLFAIM